MVTQRPFEELNLWQRIFAEHWEKYAAEYEREHSAGVPENWRENVAKMLSCGDIREGYYEYYCQDWGTTTKVGFTCKCKLCLRCFKAYGNIAGAGTVGFRMVMGKKTTDYTA
jgi:hypothetical protein